MTTSIRRVSVLHDLWIKVLCGLSLVAILFGCAPHRYQYISLTQVSEIEVVDRGVPASKVKLAGSMPTKYSLERPAYRLKFSINTDALSPSLSIDAESAHDARPLVLAHRARRKTPPDQAASCGAYSAAPDAPGELRFAWLCGSTHAEQRFISFDVVAADGTTLGEEDLPFDLRSNGFYVLSDVI